MAFVAFALSLLIAVFGGLGLISPDRLVGVVRRFQTPTGLYVAAAIRVVLGVALFLAAPTSRAPELLHVLGVVIFVAGLVTPLFGVDRFRRLLDWWSALGPGFLRFWGASALVLGLLLAYAVAL